MTVANGTCGDHLAWTLRDGVLTISGEGAMADYNDGENYAGYDGEPDFVSNVAPWYGNRDDIQAVVLPDEITTVGDWAFNECYSLTSVTIPNSVTSVGHSAFRSCYGLTTVVIGNSVTTVENSAFWMCSGLTTLIIGNSVTSVGSTAFAGCESLTSVYNLAATPQTIDDDDCVFDDVDKSTCTLYVPAVSASAYKAAMVWKDFKLMANYE
jgi:hypothetical protein